jgi:uncharacterized surface protein with fasciclin (FAS1) repeats
MKRIIRVSFLFVFMLIGCLSASAQKIDSTTQKAGKARNIDGTMMYPSKDIFDNLSASTEFSKLVNAIKTADLTATFQGRGPVTIFAPANKAFDQFPPGKLDTLLLPARKAELIGLLNYHIISGKVTSKEIYAQIKAGNGQATFKTVSGGMLIASINANRNIVLTDENGGQSVIGKFDIQQSNGVLHVVTAVLVPKTTP